MNAAAYSVGLVGARGYAGAELLLLLDRHPRFELALASSRAKVGQPIADHVPGFSSDLAFCNVDAKQLAEHELDALVLAMPNGLAAPYVRSWRDAGHDGPIVDLSADYRFDPAWTYGLPEHNREALAGATNIANPGCYATAMQLALGALTDLLAAPPHCFGISGYSGAGTTPSDKNNPDKLVNNILPYAPFDHVHEREVSVQLGRPVRFMPHVAQFFRGIHMTVAATLDADVTPGEIGERYRARYANEPLVRVSEQTPWVAANTGLHHACVGGWRVRQETRELVVYATLDNLLKGAATQALQNLNLACEFAEFEGIPHG